jgi:excisionase family DNA binding protein
MAVVKPISIPTTESELPRASENVTQKKGPGRVTISPEEKFLVGRVEAADMLSVSRRALDYLVANKLLTARRIGSRVLIPVADLRRFSRGDHPARLAG